MAQIGKLNTLKIIDFDDAGAYFDGGIEGEILWPKAEVPLGTEIGQEFEVFIYLDSEDIPLATVTRPKAQLGEFALLKVVSIEKVGAFLDWGLPKDLLLPFAEQTRQLRLGDEVIVYVYIDKSDRIAASMRLQRHTDKTPPTYSIGEAVDLLVFSKTDLGFKAVINGRHIGVLYSNEVFRQLTYGECTMGYIKAVRPDGKIDLTLSRTGPKAAQDDLGPVILERLKSEGGFLAINDKTPAETIHNLFGVSRKKFKIAIGALYKQRLIQVTDNGILLVKQN